MKGLYKYQGSANWWFRYTLANGKRIQVGLKTPDEAEAIERARTIQAEDLITKPDRAEIALVIERYLAAAMARNRKPMRPLTAESVRGNLTRFVAARELQFPTQVTRQNLEGWLSSLRTLGKAQDTLYTYARDVCAFSRWLASERHIPFDSLHGFERPQMAPQGRKNWVANKDVARVIEGALDPDLKFVLYCGFHAGLRKAEICAAKVSWFDLSNARKPVVHIQNDPDSGFLLKDSDNRTVPLTDGFAEFLAGYLKNSLPSNYALRPEKRRGKCKYRVEFRKTFLTHLRRMGVRATVHDMRRSFASNLVTNGQSIYAVAKWLGDRVDVVERSYGYLDKYCPGINKLIA